MSSEKIAIQNDDLPLMEVFPAGGNRIFRDKRTTAIRTRIFGNGGHMDAEFREVHFRKRRSIAGDPKICSGCRTCEMICSLHHEGFISPEQSRIFIKSNPFKGSYIPTYCHQCSDAPCLYACPESAITIEGIHGTVTINEEKCSGCRLCEEACPFRVIRFHQEKNRPFKCDLCHGNPECVKWCPMNALGVVAFGGEVPK